MSTYTTHKSPHATYFPTLSGGIGEQELQQFYANYFLSSNPESTKLTLLSRTIGSDRVVDELHVSFKHTQEMPWILPNVPPTHKRVEVAIVSIVTLRGGKLYAEHVYWDQASVLVQVGLLDPKLSVSQKAREKWGVKKLPVVGREAARRLVRGFEDDDVGDGEADNEMLPGWYDDEDNEDRDNEDDVEKNKKKETREMKKETKKESNRESGSTESKGESAAVSNGKKDDTGERETEKEKEIANENKMEKEKEVGTEQVPEEGKESEKEQDEADDNDEEEEIVATKGENTERQTEDESEEPQEKEEEQEA